LDRSLQLSDDSLIDKMKTNLASDGYRFRALVQTIVLSPQFLNARVGQQPDAPRPAPGDGAKLVKAAFRKAN
jgi:hypothetical protein